VTHDILAAAIEVHRRLGPGLLEATYDACLSREFAHRQMRFERQVPVPVLYRDTYVECGYRLDFVVDGCVVVEVKSVSRILPIHRAQLLTYLKLTHIKIGLLINFNVEMLRWGIYRIING
jgi:GxxExxY protein